MPNADQQKVFTALSARYKQLHASLRTLLPDEVYDDDAEPLDESVLTDVEMIGAEMRITWAAMEAILVGKTR